MTHEGKITASDLELKNNFSAEACANHSMVMTDFMLEHFASNDPTISFVHSSPGVVEIGAARELPLWARMGLKMMMPLLRPFTVSLEKTGERQLFITTSSMFPPGKSASKEGDAPAKAIIGTTESGSGIRREVVPIAKGSDGTFGDGAYLVNWYGEITGKAALLGVIRETGGANIGLGAHDVYFREVADELNMAFL